MSWETGSGLVDDFDFEVTDAWFAKDAAVENGEKLLLHLKGTTDDPDEPEYTAQIKCGPGWDSHDGGKTARHENGRDDAKFNKFTHVGKWIDRCWELGMVNAEGTGILQKRGDSVTEAKIWVGLKMHVKREHQEMSRGDEKREWEWLMPTDFLGEVGDAPATTTSASNTNATTTISTAASNGSGDLSPAIKAKLTVIAKKAENHADFVDKALEVDGVTDDDNLLQRVVDETDGGLFAELKA